MSRAVVRVPTVEFARAISPSVVDGDTVRRKGVIFRAGTYPYQNFSMSPDELRHVASTFKDAIKIDHGHPSVDGPLDFGRLESVEVSPDGTTLYGHTVHPAWVNTALADAKWLVSASFDRATKAIRRLSLVTRPQISDAELQAAFACACGGHTTTEARPMAEVEDKVARIRREIEELDEDELAALGGDEMEDDMDDDADDGLDEDPADTSDFAEGPDPEKEEMRARLAMLEERDARREVERRTLISADFAKDELRAGRIVAAEAENAAALMYQALADDDLDATPVNFSRAGKPARGTREQMVRATFAGRAPHGLMGERRAVAAGMHLLDPDAQFSGSEAETPEQKRARLDARLANTSTGRAILAERNKLAHH